MTNSTSVHLSDDRLTFLDDIIADTDTRLKNRSHVLEFTLRKIEENKQIQELIYEKVIGQKKKDRVIG